MDKPESRSSARFHVFADAESLARSAVSIIAQHSNDAIAARGQFHIVLAGGTTPRQCYALLRGAGCRFDRWQVWFGDERCLPVGHADRNDTMARLALLDHVGMMSSQIHPIPAEAGPEAAARSYSESLRDVGIFDLVLLGLGEDGHTASLFPGHEPAPAPDSPDAIAVHNAPKSPPERVSLSAARLSRARHVLFLVSGTGKRDAMSQFQRGADIPAAVIRPDAGVDVYITRDAIPEPVQP
jgi:6-phosphogluconolactonase